MGSEDLLELYGDAAFARRMASGLVGEGAVEDVWQEAWRTILERPPRPGWDVRGYVWTVVQRLALRRRRTEFRRRTREQAVAREESLPSSAELVERMELHRGVVDALLALEEPYRRTILLIYFDGLDAAEIARRGGIPVATVRTHKKRALAQLRERLQREHGSEPEWLRGLLALAGLRAADLAPAARASSLLPAVGIASALLLAGGLAWNGWRAEPRRTGPLSAADAPSREVPAESRIVPSQEALSGRNEGLRSPRDDSPPQAPTRPTLAGRVTDSAGEGIPGAEVSAWISGLSSVEPRESARADATGRYSLPLPALSRLQVRARFLTLEAWAPGFQCVRVEMPLADVGRAHEQDFDLHAGRSLQGRVLDVRGRAVPKAVVVARSSGDGDDGAKRLCLTDADGMYRLGLADGIVFEGLEAWREDVGWGELEAPPSAAQGALVRVAEIVLEERAVLRGRAVYPDGNPVRGMGITAFLVAEDGRGGFAPAQSSSGGLSQAMGYTDEEGRFALAGLCAGPFSVGAAWNFQRKDVGRGAPHELVAQPGMTEAELTFDLPRVLVETVDAEGRALEDVWVVCTPLSPEVNGAWRPPGQNLRAMTRGPSARASLTGAPVARIALTVLLPGWAKELELAAAAPGWETVLRVVVAPEQSRGTLRLLSPDAQPLAGLAVRLTTATARIPVEGTWQSDREGIVRDLPAGRFRMELDDPRATDDRWRFAPARILEIPASGSLDVRVEWERGGRLVLHFPTSAEDSPPTRARVPTPASRPNLQTWAGWQTPRAQAFLWRDGSQEEEREFLELSGAGPGSRWTSPRPLRPGSYRLETTFTDCEDTRQWVVVEAGTTQELAVPIVRLAR